MKVSKRGVQVVLDRCRYIMSFESDDINTRKSKQYIGEKADKNKEIIIVKYEELESLSTSADYGSNYLKCTIKKSYAAAVAIKSNDLTIRATIKSIEQELPTSFVKISQNTIININLIVGKFENHLVTQQGNRYVINSNFLESVFKKIDELYCSVDFFKP